MSYISNSDVAQRLGTARYVQLTDDTGSGSADENVVTEARQSAEGEVNSHLARRYAVPIDTVTHAEVAPMLASLALDLTEYRLYARRGEIPGDVTRRRDAAVRRLERVAAGMAALPSVAPIASNPALGLRATTTGEARLLSRDELGEF